MFKKAALLLIVFCSSAVLFGQYEDDAPGANGRIDTSQREPIQLSEKLLFGGEFMLSANVNAFFAELSPFVGYKIADPFYVGAGVHGSFLGVANKNFGYYGAHAFARLVLAETVFIHGEFRLLNGRVPSFTPTERKWVASPILGLGLMYGSNSWFLIGYAPNADFKEINPLESLVYRIGFYF